MSTKLKHATCYVMFRGILPLILLAAAVMRFSGFSLLYLLLVLAEPLLPSPSPSSVSGKTGSYLITSVVLCSSTLTAQIAFQAFSLIIATPDQPYGTWLKNCSTLERSLRQVGLQRVEPNDYENILRIILPDIAAFLITLIVLVLCKKLLPEAVEQHQRHLQRKQSMLRRRLESYGTYILNILGNFLVVLFLAGSGIANPCALSSVYFFTFLALATWWACYKPLGHRFAMLRVILLIYTGANLVLLYLYQFQFFQEILDPNSLIARVVGLTALVLTRCRKPWLIELNHQAEWWMYVSPTILLLLYFTLACEIRRWSTRIKEIPYASAHMTMSHSISGGFRPPRRYTTASSERQVLGTAANESLVEDRHQTYNSTDNVETTSVTPQSDVYNTDLHQADNASQTEKIRSPLASIFVYIMKQSYVSTLILMMVWSITYHSWLTFVFLLAACIIWMIPNKRNICLCVSPIIVCYAEGLLLIQYVYGFNLTADELPTKTASGYRYSQIGLMKLPHPCVHIGVQVVFTVFFMLTLRQYMRELHIKRQEYYMQGLLLHRVDRDIDRSVSTETNLMPISMGDVIDGQDGETIISFGNWMWHMLCKYWILVCAILLLVISIQEAVIYRIIYLGFFLYFVITFQLCYRFWRFSVYVFWWIVIVYSIAVLLCIYTYQFDNFPEYWMNGTGLSPEVLSDLGLETFSTAMLFAKLLTPTVFVIIICIQVHYFQKPFLKLSDVRRFRLENVSHTEETGDNGGGDVTATQGNRHSKHKADDTQSIASVQTHLSRKQRFWLWLKKAILNGYSFLDRTSVLAWRIVEIHIHKIVMFTIFVSCVSEICAINVILVMFVTVFMPAPVLHLLMSHLCQCYTGIILLAKMLYQLKLVPHEYALSNCTTVHNMDNSHLPYPFNETIDSAQYVGLERVGNLPHYLKNYVLIVVILGFEAVVRVHQAQHYNKPNTEKPPDGIVFMAIKRRNADDGLIPCFKYFVNYVFYKFGLQICFIMTMITMVVRLDAYSVIYGLFLAVLLCLSRKSCYLVWPGYVVVLIVLLILQYLSCLGAPEALCWGYPWDTLPAITRNLKVYLYLPNYTNSPNPYLLIADFFQLLFACLQWGVFCIENQANADSYPGGSNKCILNEVEEDGPIPVADFLYCKASYLDYIKAAIFQYSFWVTLIFVFIAGTAKISLFCLGYLVGFFFFLWFGMTLLTKPLCKVVRLWGFLLGYTFFVILSKSCLQLVGCVYLSRVANGYCWVIQLLGLACLRAGNYIFDQEEMALASCSQSEDDAGLTYDAICFVFLLLQLRIYQSHYFRHVVLDLEVQKSLASRGAELINTRLIAQVAEQKNREHKTLHQIKCKMEKIRKRQERLQHKAFTETQDHYIVIRGGDRYMFEEDDEETESNLDTLDMPDDSSDEELAGPLEILNAAMTGGTKGALQVVERQRSFSDTDSPHSPSPSSIRDKKQSLKPIPEHSEADADEGRDRSESIESKDSFDTAFDDDDEHQKTKESCHVRCVNGLKVTWAFIGSILDSMISVLFKISNEYRSVSLILDQEKEQEKQRRRMTRSDYYPQSPSDADTTDTWPELDNNQPYTRPEVNIKISSDDEVDDKTKISPRRSAIDLAELAKSEQEFRHRMPRILQLLIALVEAVMSRSELLCYFAMVLNTLVNASLLSLPYPISVFLWAMLSVPRPSKTYWITIMTYTEAVVVVKYLFQFGFFPWNDGTVESSPFWPPRILGIEKKDGYAAFDLVLLFCLFIHRSILNRHGLWKDAGDIDADFAMAEDKIASSNQTPADSPVKDAAAGTLAIEDTRKSGPGDTLGQENVTFESSPRVTPAGSEEKFDGQIRSRQVREDSKDKKGCFGCCKPIQAFYQQMTNPRYNAVTDVYAMMFFCDFINFLIIVFGYWAFGPVESTGAAGDEVVTRVIENNRVPIPFLAMLVVQFILIIIDRALYLRKNIFGKFMFQICLVIVVHVWMFFILPAVTNRPFNKNVPAQLWYFIKCIYFGLSAYQIRSGYPTRILGNFLTKRYNYVNLFLFKGFLLIPFLLELRALMDWMWTDTTLALSCWLKMEDIYANVFELKCWRWAERRYPTPRGVPRRKAIKYGVGGFLLFVLIFIIWFPLLLFSLASAVFKPNPPVDCTIEMKFGSFQPIFKMSAQQLQLHAISEINYADLKQQYNKNPSGTAFLASYQPSDVYVAKINGISTATWGISPPSEDALREQLLDDTIDINLFTTISFTREPKSGMTSDTVVTQFVRVLKASDPNIMSIREDLAHMINRTYRSQNHYVQVQAVFPQFIQVPVNGKPTPAVPLLGSETYTWSNITYSKGGDADVTWWILKDILPKDIFQGTGEKSPQDSLIIVSFNERVAPGALTYLTNYGILGLYLSFILVIGRFMRVQTSGLTRDVMFNFLPYVDHIWALVKDIYLVREAGEYRLEEELFAKLMFLYRSPETLIDYTRYPPEKLKQE